MTVTIVNKQTKESYKVSFPSSFYDIKNEFGDNNFRRSQINRIVANEDTVELTAEQYKKAWVIDERMGKILDDKPAEQKPARWQDEPATAAQYSYMHALGYPTDQKLTKGQASHIIDMIKAGEAGALGMAHTDGEY